MAFRHGVYTSELPTSILPARSVDSNVVFAVGTAAVDRLEAGKPRYVNRLRMYYSYDEFVSEMGWDEENFNKYSLQELAYSHFALYRGAPLVVCNVFDPAVHKTSVSSEAVSFDAKGAASLKHGSVSKLVLKNAESSTTYVEGTDYTLDPISGELSRIDGGSLPAEANVTAGYDYADVSLVDSTDVIGGINESTGESEGLELIDSVFPQFRLVPGSILAPRFSEAPAVAEPAQAPAVAEEKPARTRKSKAAAKPAEAPAEEAPKAEEKPAEAPAPAAEAKPAAKPAVLKPRADGGMLREITPRPQQAGNPYKPMLATVVETIQETGNIKTLRVVLDDPEQMANFTYEPGQVGQLSVFGAGESTFVINTPPSQKEYLQFSVMQAGEVTSAIHRLSPGDKVGVRAPLGNFFPYNDWKGKNIFFVGGGIGMAPIRTIMLHVLEHKADYGKVSLLYGARSPRDMAFSYELEGWLANPDLDCTLCIDNPYEGWPHKVGLIPNVLTELNPSPDNCVAVLCGPPIMIKFTLQALEKLGFQPENIVTTLEKRMKCGIGICGRCNIGSHYVCVDGPVFTMAQLKELPPEL